jgi:hypothetical protein
MNFSVAYILECPMNMVKVGLFSSHYFNMVPINIKTLLKIFPYYKILL